MGFKCGIVGLPNVGKSTLFNALSNAGAEAANYPFCTIDPNVGMVPVPDPRLDKLAALVKTTVIQPAVVRIVDIAGLVRGASKNEGLGNKFLGNILECDAILHVLRCFDDPNIVHVETKVDPMRDKEIIDTELQLKDLEGLESRKEKVYRAAKSGDKESMKDLDLLERLIDRLQRGQNIRGLQLIEEEQEKLDGYFLLTAKPVLYVCNVDEGSIPHGNDFSNQVKAMAAAEGAESVVICAAIESQISAIEDLDERKEFLAMMNLEEPALNLLIRASYSLLGLQTYFTAGVKEVRAWTIHNGWKAPQAAGVIHTDFEKGFIRAEVIKYDDFVKFGSEAAVKEAGKMAVQGKEYVVQDGDVMHFRFNV